jgi:hypothetical protein
MGLSAILAVRFSRTSQPDVHWLTPALQPHRRSLGRAVGWVRRTLMLVENTTVLTLLIAGGTAAALVCLVIGAWLRFTD